MSFPSISTAGSRPEGTLSKGLAHVAGHIIKRTLNNRFLNLTTSCVMASKQRPATWQELYATLLSMKRWTQ